MIFFGIILLTYSSYINIQKSSRLSIIILLINICPKNIFNDGINWPVLFNGLFIKSSTSDCIFNIGYFPDIKVTGFRGGHGVIINRIKELPSGLESYNKFFNTNYTPENITQNLLIMCNTFVIPSQMFENMMDWMEQYFLDDFVLDTDNSSFFSHCDNPGHVIEALVGMFLSLEVYKGAKYYPFNLKHIWPLYKNKSY